METLLDDHPTWKEKGWLPIAGDGVGNYYVIDTKISRAGTNPVYFLDHERDLDHPQYIVASDLWKFLLFLFKREIEWKKTRTATWPFNKSIVLADDPVLSEYQGIVSLPWE
jgi:cell wall assembly regulator SMI1